jgi:uncharacterized membrane protein
MLAIVDTVALIFKREEWEKWGFYVLVGTVASFVPAIITGLMNASRQERTSEFVAFMPTHRNLIFVMAFLTVTALAIRAARRSRLDGASKWVYLGLVYAAVLMIAVAGDYGGKMVYGADYLPF